MTVSRNQGYFEYLRYNQVVIDYFTNYPLVLHILWTINIFGGIVTLKLMLMRKEAAFYFSVATFVSMFLLDFITFGFRNRWNVIGTKGSTTALSLISLGPILLLQRGRIILKSDKIVEYNFLNHPRVFTYTQIYEVKQGAHADQTWIRYYPRYRNGQINYRSIKGKNLISILGDADMRNELIKRISGPEPYLP